ncbi:MAG: hypothetical protein AAGJ32_12725 [Pseudomonadota bacterium]
MRTILLATAAAMFATTAAAETFGKDDEMQVGDFILKGMEEPMLCVSREKSNFKVLDDQTLLFISGEDMYLNKLSDNCPALYMKGARTSLQTNTRRVCRNETLFVVKGGDVEAGCNLGAFTKVQALSAAG